MCLEVVQEGTERTGRRWKATEIITEAIASGEVKPNITQGR